MRAVGEEKTELPHNEEDDDGFSQGMRAVGEDALKRKTMAGIAKPRFPRVRHEEKTELPHNEEDDDGLDREAAEAEEDAEAEARREERQRRATLRREQKSPLILAHRELLRMTQEMHRSGMGHTFRSIFDMQASVLRKGSRDVVQKIAELHKSQIEHARLQFMISAANPKRIVWGVYAASCSSERRAGPFTLRVHPARRPWHDWPARLYRDLAAVPARVLGTAT